MTKEPVVPLPNLRDPDADDALMTLYDQWCRQVAAAPSEGPWCRHAALWPLYRQAMALVDDQWQRLDDDGECVWFEGGSLADQVHAAFVELLPGVPCCRGGVCEGEHSWCCAEQETAGAA